MKISLHSLKFVGNENEKIKEIFKDGIGIAYAEIKESISHYHRKTFEWYIIVEGRGIVYLNEEKVEVGGGDIIFIQPGIR